MREKYFYLSRSFFWVLGLLLCLAFLIGPLWWVLIPLLVAAPVLWMFRKGPHHHLKLYESPAHIVLAPISGKVKSVYEVDQHDFFGEDLQAIELVMPFFTEYGVYLPVKGEILEVRHSSGKSRFRYSKERKDETLGTLFLLGEEKLKVGLELQKCPLGMLPQSYGITGDAGATGARLGYIVFGGTVIVYVKDFKIEIKVGDQVQAGETVIAAK